MFFGMAILLFSGYPIAFILGGLSIVFGLLGYMIGTFEPIEFFNFVPRIWGFAAENLVLVAVPTFVFMGVVMERSGIASDLLYCCQILLRRVPGALALSVTVMGTILAAMTGIIGASVTMMTAMALPSMLRQRYSPALATGTIAASGTLGILIPPSIMLIFMADLMQLSVGSLFMAALLPGLTLAGLYLTYIFIVAVVKPVMAPPLPPGMLSVPGRELPKLLLKGFVPPVILIGTIKCSILFGWATPSEAGAVGSFGALVIAVALRRLTAENLKAMCTTTALTLSFIFFIIISATCFANVFRSLGGDDIVEEIFAAAGFGSWGILITIMVMVFFLGFILDFIEIALIMFPIFAPLVVDLNFGTHVPQDQVLFWFTVLVAVNLQTSFLTPPFGYALFYMKGVAPKEVKISQIYAGIVPFVLLQLIGLAAVVAFPQLVLWLPGVVYD
ncbi:MAG: TRAP transporter large permease subunit [Alphaproteobacteria bacterium]|nr:TRAP transporter large permease subunit [Alphaproteobacteria bacterium]